MPIADVVNAFEALENVFPQTGIARTTAEKNTEISDCPVEHESEGD